MQPPQCPRRLPDLASTLQRLSLCHQLRPRLLLDLATRLPRNFAWKFNLKLPKLSLCKTESENWKKKTSLWSRRWFPISKSTSARWPIWSSVLQKRKALWAPLTRSWALVHGMITLWPFPLLAPCGPFWALPNKVCDLYKCCVVYPCHTICILSAAIGQRTVVARAFALALYLATFLKFLTKKRRSQVLKTVRWCLPSLVGACSQCVQQSQKPF